jgi:hypothetical protein
MSHSVWTGFFLSKQRDPGWLSQYSECLINHFYVQSPSNPLIEDYTQIFYMIDERDIPSLQSKMSLGRPKSMRKVNGLSRIFTDFYVPAFTPRLSITEISLQLSENIIFQIDSLCSLGAVWIKNSASNSSSIVVSLRCLTKALVLLRLYTAAA